MRTMVGWLCVTLTGQPEPALVSVESMDHRRSNGNDNDQWLDSYQTRPDSGSGGGLGGGSGGGSGAGRPASVYDGFATEATETSI